MRVFVSLVRALSLETCHALSRLLAIILYDWVRFRRDVVEENLQIALPGQTPTQRRGVAIAMWEHLLLMSVEIIHAPRKIHDTNWRKFFHIEGLRQLVDTLLQPRPRVVVTAHFGNFEIAGYITGLLGFRTHTVARTIDNPYIDSYINRFRECTGQYILPKVGSSPQADTVLQTNGTLVLLGDQHAGGRGCWVDFMGRPASCHKALALFTLMSGAPMVAVYCKREGRPMKFELGLAGIIDPQVPCAELAGVKQLTQWYNHVLEREIRRSPHQYWWVHRRWRGEPLGKKRNAASTSDAGEEASQAPSRAAA